jgi:formate C-acetyltransferase
VVETFSKYRKTHNDAVFDAYTADVRRCRSSHVLTGLPDAYGRGRIIGDYRRVALYGVKRLIERKQEEKNDLDDLQSTDDVIRDREELAEQIRALKELQQMAASYGFDVSRPARNAREAVQWLYLGYLAGVKEQNGAAMSLGRTSTFLDIYFERDLASGALTEELAQEIIDDFVINLGHRIDCRDGRRWAAAGHENELPVPADALQPRSGAGAEPDDLVLAASA